MKLKRDGLLYDIVHRWQLYLLVLVPLIYFIVFKYIPMYGLIIAFKNFQPSKGIWGSNFIGLANFSRFVSAYKFKPVFINTLLISTLTVFIQFPFTILLALALHSSTLTRFKKITQTTLYAPHFISTVVVVSILIQILHPRFGLVNEVIRLMGFQPISFMSDPRNFRTIYVISELWQHAGWGTVLYLASLASVDVNLHEAAEIDGASRLSRLWHIDVMSILPTITIVLILNTAEVMGVGFEKVFLMQNDLNLSVSEVLPTYVYKMGMANSLPDYSYATAIGMFSSVISLSLIIIVNRIAKTVSDISLW